jgi:hypothetical protein
VTRRTLIALMILAMVAAACTPSERRPMGVRRGRRSRLDPRIFDHTAVFVVP